MHLTHGSVVVTDIILLKGYSLTGGVVDVLLYGDTQLGFHTHQELLTHTGKARVPTRRPTCVTALSWSGVIKG